MSVTIRPEGADDASAIHETHALAFGQPYEARLVDALRQGGALRISLVADVAGDVVGHIAFSPVTLPPAHPELAGLGLAPVAVRPDHQRRGIGSKLVYAGLGLCRQQGADFVVVLGHPEYYPRFGFVPAVPRGIRSNYPVPDDVFMVQELRPGALMGVLGLVEYHPAFG